MKRIAFFTLIFAAVLCISSCNRDEGNVPYKLCISCEEVVQFIDDENYGIKPEKREIVPKDGFILELDTNCFEGDDVYSCVSGVLRDQKLHFEGSDGYFTAFCNIYAGDCGDFSGWMFFVNGELSDVGASDTIIRENDLIEFKYIVDYNTLFE